MADDLDLMGRVLAHEAQRAIPTAEKRAVAVRPDARVLSTLALSGHDHTLMAVAFGRPGQRPMVKVIPDPRRWPAQQPLFVWLSTELDRWFQACEREGSFPQLWVPSAPVAGHLDLLADLHRFSSDLAVRSMGRSLALFSERLPVEGQQTLMVATDVLREHWITGQSPDDEHHLGALLTWISPPPSVPLWEAVARAEATPMGNKTTPEQDRATIEPLLEKLSSAWKTDPAAVARLSAELERELTPVVLTTWEATVAAMNVLSQTFAPLPSLPQLEARDREHFAGWCRWRDGDRPLPLRDSPKAAAFKLAAREDAIEQAEAASVHGDLGARLRAQSEGRVIEGIVRDLSVRRAGHSTIGTFALVTNQPMLRLRQRDAVAWLGDPRLVAVVESVRREGTSSLVALRVTKGMRSVGFPKDGQRMTWGPPEAEWGRIVQQRSQMKARLAVTPWTHEGGTTPASNPCHRGRPADPLAAVEALR